MTPWTPVTQQSETWTAKTIQGETWAPASTQAETWTAEVRPVRGFDPAGFDNTPRFDTGGASGVWWLKAQQTEAWTVQP